MSERAVISAKTYKAVILKWQLWVCALKRWTLRILETLSEPITPHTLQHITNTDIYIFALTVSYWFESQINELPVGHACRPESGHPPVMKLPRPPTHINKHPWVLIKCHLKARRGADMREDNPNHRGWSDNSERVTNDQYHSALVTHCYTLDCRH